MTLSVYCLAKQRRIRHSSIDAFMSQAVTPKEYCELWVPKFHDISPDERGYRQFCIKELARITGYSKGSIQNWGVNFEKAPDAVSRMCAMASILNRTSTDWSDFIDEQ
ncbi:hypothetical protein [Adonisia turfae]|nr:hypothetical protein [Adonisia turfae]